MEVQRASAAAWGFTFVLNVLIAAILAGSAAAAPPAAYDRGATEASRRAYEEKLTSPDGWLSVAGLFFLQPGPNTVGSRPDADIRLPRSSPLDAGRIVFESGRVFFEPAHGIDTKVNGAPVAGRIELRGPDEATHRRADRLAIGQVQLHVHLSGDRVAIRMRDPENPLRTQFTGVRWFPIDPAMAVRGRFIKFPAPRTLTIQNVVGDVDEVKSSGEVEFTLQGHTARLLAIDEDDDLWFVFTDTTADSGETYKIRFLYTGFPEPDGTILMDFNRVENPPCAYNPFTTCPLPPSQNRLTFPIRAGEKAYPLHEQTAGSQQ